MILDTILLQITANYSRDDLMKKLEFIDSKLNSIYSNTISDDTSLFIGLGAVAIIMFICYRFGYVSGYKDGMTR